jgi:hypothetical protein
LAPIRDATHHQAQDDHGDRERRQAGLRCSYWERAGGLDAGLDHGGGGGGRGAHPRPLRYSGCDGAGESLVVAVFVDHRGKSSGMLVVVVCACKLPESTPHRVVAATTMQVFVGL